MSDPLFKKGDRVEMTAWGREVARVRLSEYRSLVGTVATNSRDPQFVTVLRDTQMTPQRWLVQHWRHRVPAPSETNQ